MLDQVRLQFYRLMISVEAEGSAKGILVEKDKLLLLRAF